MRIVMINGGLGNQAFQYIFSRYIEETSKDDCVLDNTAFCMPNTAHQGWELEKIFGIKPKLLSDHFSADVWSDIVRQTRLEGKTNIADLLKEHLKTDIQVLCEGDQFRIDTQGFARPYTGNLYSIQYNSYVPTIQSIKGNVYYYGYWINMHWFQYIIDHIVKEFTFIPVKDEYNRRMQDEISGCHSVSVHVRRGDFVKLGWALKLDWYSQSVKRNMSVTLYFICFPMTCSGVRHLLKRKFTQKSKGKRGVSPC